MDISQNPNFIPTVALLKNFIACIYAICGAAKIYSRLAFRRILNF